MPTQPVAPAPDLPHKVIRLGRAAILPLADLRRLQAVERLAAAEVIESAEIQSMLADHREWVAAGRPGAVSHEQAMAELLAQSRESNVSDGGRLRAISCQTRMACAPSGSAVAALAEDSLWFGGLRCGSVPSSRRCLSRCVRNCG
jgi:hypothetical protein